MFQIRTQGDPHQDTQLKSWKIKNNLCPTVEKWLNKPYRIVTAVLLSLKAELEILCCMISIMLQNAESQQKYKNMNRLFPYFGW